MAVGVVACGLGVSACGGFDSAASGEGLIKQYVKKFGQGKVDVKSANCPGGVKQKVGGTYECKVVLHEGSSAPSVIPRLAIAIPPARIEIARPTLEEVFVKLVAA